MGGDGKLSVTHGLENLQHCPFYDSSASHTYPCRFSIVVFLNFFRCNLPCVASAMHRVICFGIVSDTAELRGRTEARDAMCKEVR
jgi:hypothetical protein